MPKDIESISLEEFSNNVAGFFERVVRGREIVVVEDERGEAAVLKPISSRNRSTVGKRTRADREAFLLSLGGWRDLVDTDKLVKNIYESRSISTRPPIEL
jgi:hypothetical protein